jgi:hypothetical protein
MKTPCSQGGTYRRTDGKTAEHRHSSLLFPIAKQFWSLKYHIIQHYYRNRQHITQRAILWAQMVSTCHKAVQIKCTYFHTSTQCILCYLHIHKMLERFPKIRKDRPTCCTSVHIAINYWTPNVRVDWETFLLRIREIPGSNLGPETGYPDWGFS